MWDGGVDQPKGMSQSRGIAIWFVIPEPFYEIVENAVNELRNSVGNDSAKSLLWGGIRVVVQYGTQVACPCGFFAPAPRRFSSLTSSNFSYRFVISSMPTS